MSEHRYWRIICNLNVKQQVIKVFGYPSEMYRKSIEKIENKGYSHSLVMGLNEALKTDANIITVTESEMQFSLSSAYPNPFNPTTTIEFSASEAGYASVKIYNLMGQVVGVLMDGMVDAKTYNLTWNAKDLSSGVYMIKAESNGNVATQKVMLLK